MMMKQLCAMLALLPAAFAYTQFPDPKGELEMRNKDALYLISVDSKEFSQLPEIFTEDAFADLAGPQSTGVDAITTYLTNLTTGLVSQHAMSTFAVESYDGGQTANSTAIVVATILGQGNQTGEIVTVYGKFTDSWVHDNGAWKMNRKIFSLFPPGFIGNRALFPG